MKRVSSDKRQDKAKPTAADRRLAGRICEALHYVVDEDEIPAVAAILSTARVEQRKRKGRRL